MPLQQSEEVKFHDASAYFSHEEWKLLHEWQKELYRNVMKEIHQALIALGPLIATTVFSLRAQEKQDQAPVVNQDSERRHGVPCSPTEVLTHHDALLKLHREENLCLKNLQDEERRKQSEGLSTGFPFLNTDVCLKKEEPASIFIDHLGEEVGESSTDPTAGYEVDSFRIKNEEENPYMNHQHGRSMKSISSPTGINKSVNANKERENDWEKIFMCSESGSGFDHDFNVTNQKRLKPEDALKGCNAYVSSISPKSSAIKPKELHRGERPYTWTEYEGNFTESALLSPHQKTDTALEVFICSQCGNCFNQSAKNSTHKQINNRDQQNTCSECKKSLQPSTKRNKDQDKDMGKKCYTCSECGKSFQKSQKLMIHQRVHTGEKPYPCHTCGKNFRQLPHLVIHQRMHTGEKPYVCNICYRGFIDSSHLKRHHQIHTRVTTNMNPTGIETRNNTVEG